MSWREPFLRLMRVPAYPARPPGSPPQVFRAAPAFLTLRLLRWGVTQMVALAGLLWALQFIRWVDQSRAPEFVVWLLRAGEVFGWVAFVFEFVCGWLIVRLDYEMRWYMLSDRAIRIREGVATVREKTIALANVQNLSIRQGPLQRFLGIADVEVKTAGGGGSSGPHEGKKKGGEPMHVAYFRGVANAEEIRDLVREGVRRQRNAGLGDPEERVPDGDMNAAAVDLLREARALRAAVS
jgi:uncharacterized membrane protein YdbT with pleckstrin-like domain